MAVVYALALVMVLMARARDEGPTVEVVHMECGRARLAHPSVLGCPSQAGL